MIAGGAFLAGAAGLLGACSGEKKPQFTSIDITGADYAKDFALTDHNGQARSIKDFQGKVVVVPEEEFKAWYFGGEGAPEPGKAVPADAAHMVPHQ